MNDAHHVDFDGTVETELLSDPGHFVCREHDSKSKEHIVREGHQPEEQKSCLHKSGQANGRNLLAPLIEPVRVSAWDAEHIQTTDCHLNEKNTAALNVLEEYLHDAVGKRNQTQKTEQSEVCKSPG